MGVARRSFVDVETIRRVLPAVAGLLFAVGVVLRLYNINQSDFIFFDEGLYLNHNRAFGALLAGNYPSKLTDLVHAFYLFLVNSLASGKGLWFILSDLRLFAGAMESWYVPRMLSAGLGLATFFVTQRFAARWFRSPAIGWLAAAVLMVLPSHVFYSRTGLQEAVSTLLVMAGFYYYVFPRKLSWRTFAAGLLMAAAFFSNYRLIILPILVAVAEVWESFARGERPQGRKFLWLVLTFFSGVFIIGNVNHGENTYLIFAWMFHQAQMAQEQVAWLNFFSYPYYLFRLENVIFGLLFLGNIYFLFRRKWMEALPFLLVCVQMAGFSLATDKAARYVCVVTPFMAMAVAYVSAQLFLWKEGEGWRRLVAVGVIVMLAMLGLKSISLARSVSDYRSSAQFLLAQDADVKFLSTQSYIQNLYLHQLDNVQPVPNSFEALVSYYARGYRFMVICPQAYVSWTDDRQKFSPPLKGYLSFMARTVEPVKVYGHFSEAVLERFVFEHSANLSQSIRFLNKAKRIGYGQLRVYDLNKAIPRMLQALSQAQSQNKELVPNGQDPQLP